MKQSSGLSVINYQHSPGFPQSHEPVDYWDSSGRPLFDEILVRLRKSVSMFVLRGFFQPLAPVSLEDETLTLAAPSDFHRNWISDHYIGELSTVTQAILDETCVIRIVYDEKVYAKTFIAPKETESKPGDSITPEHRSSSKVAAVSQHRPLEPSRHTVPHKKNRTSNTISLSPKYSFSNFVRGPSNEMACASCLAVAEEPGMRYSPLFLFGPTGVGKTHLLQAIGLTAQSREPELRVVYMSAEQWVNEYIQAIRNRQFDDFRKKYRSGCDLLLIDDIQFLAGKDASQDEFFHTFNSLHASHRQIVVTSDRYPHEISGLEERLQTRLGWGLIADIKPPEMETRVAILQQKAEESGRNLPVEVAHYLADHIRSSVRALEGALVRLLAYASVTGETITLSKAKEYLRPMLSRNEQLTMDQIQEVVCNYYDVRTSEMLGKSRQRRVTLARQMSMYLARKHLRISLPEIGRSFGRDHTTVLSSVRKIAGLKATDSGTLAVILRLEDELH
jgi:chromosomal replication initiator protein